MPKPLSSSERARLSDTELREAYLRAANNLWLALDETPIFEKDALTSWFNEVAECWNCLSVLQKEFERRWKPVTSATAEEAEAAWRYWNAVERIGGKIAR